MENEAEIHNLLVKTVKDNIDKFEKVNDTEFLFKNLKVKGIFEKYPFQEDQYNFRVTIIYKNLSTEYVLNNHQLLNTIKNNEKTDDVFFNLQKNYEKRQKDKFIEQQEQDLKELKKLCNTKN